MPHLEPSYLRYIYDGLEKGDLHPDNAAALPEGLIGLYEAAFDESKPVRERQKLLETFSIWALLKKEVSAKFVAGILETPTQEIIDFIATYSNWFTSPESGKYQLYHERLKMYLLQKLSEQEIATLHNKLVTRLEQAIEVQKQDEFEIYGLEFLCVHYFTIAMITGDGKKLIVLSYDKNHWQRQLKLSKGFEWTKKGLKQVMTWASKFNDEEVIECGLQMVDLQHQEQNDAPQIVALVADGDIDTALKRIETFGGNDKEDLQRKFILYMLCLMELTLLESKDKPFRKEALEKILKHFDENIPIDHSILNWDEFFPSYLIYLISIELKKIDLNYNELYKRTNGFDTQWLNKKKSPDSIQIDFLLECILNINFDYYYSKHIALLRIARILFNKGDLDKAKFIIKEALSNVEDIRSISEKSSLLSKIATELYNQGEIKKSKLVMQEAIAYTEDISDHWHLSVEQGNLAIELAKQGRFVEALAHARRISLENNTSVESLKCTTLVAISTEQINQGYLKEAELNLKKVLKYARLIDDVRSKSETLAKISTELYHQGKLNESESILNESLFLALEIVYPWEKNENLEFIATELINQEKINESLICSKNISEEVNMRNALIKIYIELANQDKLDESISIIQEYIISDIDIRDDFWKSMELSDIALELGNQGKFDIALVCAREISIDSEKSSLLSKIATELFNRGNIEESKLVMQEAITIGKTINDNEKKDDALMVLSIEMVQQNNEVDAIEYARLISDFDIKSLTLSRISTKLFRQGKVSKLDSLMKESLLFARSINNNKSKILRLSKIASELFKQENTVEAKLVILEALKSTENINDNWEKSNVLRYTSTVMVWMGNVDEAKLVMQEALNYARLIEDGRVKSYALSQIAFKIFEQEKVYEIEFLLQESIECALNINSEWEKCMALRDIVIQLFDYKQYELVETIVQNITLTEERISCWKEIGKNIFESNGYFNAIEMCKKFSGIELKNYIKKGIISSLQVYNTNYAIAVHTIKDQTQEVSAIEYILRDYALNQLLFENIPKEKIQRFNRTLNIQWAIDIKNQLLN
jgi:tetratricopeptide (TPR) repeat protein